MLMLLFWLQWRCLFTHTLKESCKQKKRNKISGSWICKLFFTITMYKMWKFLYSDTYVCKGFLLHHLLPPDNLPSTHRLHRLSFFHLKETLYGIIFVISWKFEMNMIPTARRIFSWYKNVFFAGNTSIYYQQ